MQGTKSFYIHLWHPNDSQGGVGYGGGTGRMGVQESADLYRQVVVTSWDLTALATGRWVQVTTVCRLVTVD